MIISQERGTSRHQCSHSFFGLFYKFLSYHNSELSAPDSDSVLVRNIWNELQECQHLKAAETSVEATKSRFFTTAVMQAMLVGSEDEKHVIDKNRISERQTEKKVSPQAAGSRRRVNAEIHK